MIVILALLVLVSGCLEVEEEQDPLTIIRVVDGDTIELASGETVRLLCVDTPELGEEGYHEAKTFTSSIIGKKVRLEGDIGNRDRFGRLLRKVYFLGEDNKEYSLGDLLINNALAKPLVIEPNTNLC